MHVPVHRDAGHVVRIQDVGSGELVSCRSFSTPLACFDPQVVLDPRARPPLASRFSFGRTLLSPALTVNTCLLLYSSLLSAFPFLKALALLTPDPSHTLFTRYLLQTQLTTRHDSRHS